MDHGWRKAAEAAVLLAAAALFLMNSPLVLAADGRPAATATLADPTPAAEA